MANNNPTGINQYTRWGSTALKVHKDLRSRREYIAGVDPAKALGKGGVASKSARKALAKTMKLMREGYGAKGRTLSAVLGDVSSSTAIRNSARIVARKR